MNCREAVDLVHAHIDGELDLVTSLEIEQHLAGCAACKVQYDSLRESASAVRALASYHGAPQALRARIAAALPHEPRRAPSAMPWGWLRRAAPFALALVLVAAVLPVLLRPGADERLAQEVVAGHVRSLLAGHLTDVASSDQHTVKPWMVGKTDFSPPVKDLGAQGYALAGARLDYLDERTVAALVYKHRQHVINLFIWPAEGTSPLAQASLRGYNLAHFAGAGMAYWAVSDLNPEELRRFAELLSEGGPSTR
jgi:anti-sigma factor RsiW